MNDVNSEKVLREVAVSVTTTGKFPPTMVAVYRMGTVLVDSIVTVCPNTEVMGC